MLVIFSGIYSCASHRCVPSVSFVCLLNFHETPFLLHKTILHFTDLCSSISGNPLLLTSLCIPGVDAWSWRIDGTGLVLLPTAELTKLCRNCVQNDIFCNWHYSDLIPCKNFMELRVWGRTLIWTLWCSSGSSTYLQGRLLCHLFVGSDNFILGW